MPQPAAPQSEPPTETETETETAPPPPPSAPREVGGPPGPEPTRYGDWERNGRCIDF
jgi:hypothetical protein